MRVLLPLPPPPLSDCEARGGLVCRTRISEEQHTPTPPSSLPQLHLRQTNPPRETAAAPPTLLLMEKRCALCTHRCAHHTRAAPLRPAQLIPIELCVRPCAQCHASAAPAAAPTTVRL